jgi:hypothetical protein
LSATAVSLTTAGMATTTGTPATAELASTAKTTAVTPEIMGTPISRRGVISTFGGSNIRDTSHSRNINTSEKSANCKVESCIRNRWNIRGMPTTQRR